VEEGGVRNAVEAEIFDPYATKHWAIKFATDVAVTILRIDQVYFNFLPPKPLVLPLSHQLY